MPVAPKSVRIQSICQYILTLLGSTSVKAARKHVDEIDLMHAYIQTKEALWHVLRIYVENNYIREDS